MKAEGLVKQDHIVEAAIKRFSHFGINKTTLTEIADDLSVSKPLLFYYFNDKNSLIAAVAGKIIQESMEGFETALQQAHSVEEGLLSIVEVKREYFKKYYLLAIQSDGVDINKIPPEIKELFVGARKKTEKLISALLEKGVQQKALKPLDPEKTSHLLVETLSAFEYCIKGRKAVPEMHDIDEMFNKQKEVLEMFINGLKSQTTAGK